MRRETTINGELQCLAGAHMRNKIQTGPMVKQHYTGADPGFFLGEGALVSCSTSTPINHIVLFLGGRGAE